MATTEEILSGLNDNQREAVLDYEGPCFILAGPGAGKTKTVVSRTQYMIHQGIDPSSLVLFTFTNKAAREIRERVAKVIGEATKKITIGTYHSVCVRILKQYAEYIGFEKNFTIFDQEDSAAVLKKITKTVKIEAEDAASFISYCKEIMATPRDAEQYAETDQEKLKASAYRMYQRELKAQNAMDFDDLITNTIYLLERNPEVLSAINARFKYVTADEFHDSSQRDIRFVELLAGTDKNVCMILDDEQSIYSFRGADIESVLNVGRVFPELKTFILQQNYRSTSTIVQAARSLIKKNKKQLEKTIYTNNELGEKLVYFAEPDQDMESARVIKLIMALTRQYNLKYNEIAILYRMSYLSRKIEDKLLLAGIPYKIIGGTPFYARKEIKDVLSYARIVNNPYDFEALKRSISEPKRGIGDASIEKILEHARSSRSMPIDFVTACSEVKLSGKAGAALERYSEILRYLKKVAEEGTAADFINAVISRTGYRKYLFDTEKGGEAEERFANLVELIELANGFDSITELLQNTSLDAQIDDLCEEDDNRIQMLTMHASKGLEYPAVIIVGANEGITPHWRATDVRSIEEERRLFYVAMTRAEKYLFITRPKLVVKQGRTEPGFESRFIRDIDENYMLKST